MAIDTASLPRSRAEAIRLGVDSYFTGKPCKRGHFPVRRVGYRACTECERAKWLEASRKKRSSLTYRQKENERNAQAMARKRAEDAEWVERKNASNRDLMKRRRDSDPEYRAAVNAFRRDLRANNDDYRNEVDRKNKEWREQNPEKVRSYGNNRRARERCCEGHHSGDDIAFINQSQGFVCVYCGASTADDYHVDHIIPLSRGGSNWPSNIQILCARCNLSKGPKTHDEFAALLGVAANDNLCEPDEIAA